MKTNTEQLDQLTRQRLGRLGQVPVDTSNLEKRLEAALWQQSQSSQRTRFWTGRRLASLAAAILIAVGAMFFIVQSGNTPVVAAPIELAQLHQRLVDGQIPMVPVSNIEQASQYLQTDWSEAPPLPDPTAATVTSCCKHNLQNRKVACILMDYRGQRVTMMVGRNRDLVCGAKHHDMLRNGKHYAIHESGGLQMVMIENKGRWICLMSPLSINSLVDLADSLRF